MTELSGLLASLLDLLAARFVLGLRRGLTGPDQHEAKVGQQRARDSFHHTLLIRVTVSSTLCNLHANIGDDCS